MLEARGGYTATLLDDGRVLVEGGGSGTALASAEVYGPSTGAWTATASMMGRRVGHSAALLADGTLLVAGGISGGLGGGLQVSDILASAELFDPVAGSWTAAGSMRGSAIVRSRTWRARCDTEPVGEPANRSSCTAGDQAGA